MNLIRLARISVVTRKVEGRQTSGLKDMANARVSRPRLFSSTTCFRITQAALKTRVILRTEWESEGGTQDF